MIKEYDMLSPERQKLYKRLYEALCDILFETVNEQYWRTAQMCAKYELDMRTCIKYEVYALPHGAHMPWHREVLTSMIDFCVDNNALLEGELEP